jgi:hypothetical protein
MLSAADGEDDRTSRATHRGLTSNRFNHCSFLPLRPRPGKWRAWGSALPAPDFPAGVRESDGAVVQGHGGSWGEEEGRTARPPPPGSDDGARRGPAPRRPRWRHPVPKRSVARGRSPAPASPGAASRWARLPAAGEGCFAVGGPFAESLPEGTGMLLRARAAGPSAPAPGLPGLSGARPASRPASETTCPPSNATFTTFTRCRPGSPRVKWASDPPTMILSPQGPQPLDQHGSGSARLSFPRPGAQPGFGRTGTAVRRPPRWGGRLRCFCCCR